MNLKQRDSGRYINGWGIANDGALVTHLHASSRSLLARLCSRRVRGNGVLKLPMATPMTEQPMQEEERQVAVGLGFCHNQINILAQRFVESSADAGALARVLQARGLVTEEELAVHRAAEQERLDEVLHQLDFGIAIADEFPDKYALPPDTLPRIDCESRYHLCRGACCALRFALSSQDLDEAVVRWELGRPYLIRQARDGRCVHQDRESFRCTVYQHRPGVCRMYDCSKDSRIWSDFENRVINADLFAMQADGSRRPQFREPLRRDPPASVAAQSKDRSC
jgi:Fe-S-cluster containining protein